ncbi:hypothetical protein [Streptomyces sp. NPDC001568]|uniref:hypothetical protein n=1 Tax=Streptomyces sp. NPDC001568 TaxID=3364588 RepID=UPI00368AD961
MDDTRLALGPLEQADGRWVVGDAGRAGGTWVEFRPDGLCPYESGSEGETITWSRIMIGISVTIGRGTPSHGGHITVPGMLGALPGLRGRGVGHLNMTVRHPYEDRTVYFDRHPRRYELAELHLLDVLMRDTVEAGEAHLLGDAAWLAHAVEQLTPARFWTTSRAFDRAVARARESASAATG